jgi:hypothetical protein
LRRLWSQSATGNRGLLKYPANVFSTRKEFFSILTIPKIVTKPHQIRQGMLMVNFRVLFVALFSFAFNLQAYSHINLSNRSVLSDNQAVE